MNLPQLRRLVGNPDAYALQNEDGSWTPVRKPLDDSVLAGHLDKRYTVGTYVGHGSPTVSRTLVLDFDSGLAHAHIEAKRAHAAFIELGFAPRHAAIEFSGKKGYHVWLVLAQPRPNAELRRVGRAVLALADLPAATEVFPKQDEVRDLGNLVKLPGGIHQVTKNANDFEGIEPMPVPLPVWERVLASLPEEKRAKYTGTQDNRFPCLGIIQQGVAEGGRNTQLFHLAAMFRRHGAEDELVRTILGHVNELGDPLDDAELDSICRSSATSGPICGQLPQDVQDACGDACMRTILDRLKVWPGQVRGALIGEPVVVTVAERDGDKVSFAHDDLELAKGVLRHGNRA